ncbi:MAG: GNAT family N-acetyltransferase [Alphaproteobacteria bacterium]
MLELVSPSKKYKKSFIDSVREWKEDKTKYGEGSKDLDIDFLEKNFDEDVQSELNKAIGKPLPKGYVPETVLWLVKNENYLGKISIRHSLTPSLRIEGGHIGYSIRPSERRKGYGKKILELAFPILKKMELEGSLITENGKILITCDKDNIGSQKIIENAGGVFEKEEFLPEKNVDKY